MDRIQKIEESKIREDSLLCEVIERKNKSGILLPDSVQGKDEGIDHMVVVVVGNKVDDIEVGDIIMLMPEGVRIPMFPYGEKVYGLVQRYNCSIIVSKENFKEKP